MERSSSCNRAARASAARAEVPVRVAALMGSYRERRWARLEFPQPASRIHVPLSARSSSSARGRTAADPPATGCRRGTHPQRGHTAPTADGQLRSAESSTPLVPRAVAALRVTAVRARRTDLYRVRPPPLPPSRAPVTKNGPPLSGDVQAPDKTEHGCAGMLGHLCAGMLGARVYSTCSDTSVRFLLVPRCAFS